MLRWFTCPDGKAIEVQECLDKCRLQARCLTLPTLVEVGTERKWTGIASTTQLLNGTMYEYLKLTNDYAINPRRDKAFALLGTHHHILLEERAVELGLPAEISLTEDERNVFDLLEYANGEYVLTDYKTWGAYKTAKTLGIVVASSEVTHYTDKAGKKRQKTIKEYTENWKLGDWFDTQMQLGRYKLMIEDKLGITIARMQVQITVRDGGLQSASKQGVTENMYLREVPPLPREEVEAYFTRKNLDLTDSTLYGWTAVCNQHENWDGRRCARYCEVWMHCPKGKIDHVEE